MLSFLNTEIAFRNRTDPDLRKAYLMFRAISNPALVMVGKSLINLLIKTGIPVGWIVKPTVYRHFAGGESIDDCLKTIRMLDKFGVMAILDYSVEGKENTEEIQLSLDETLRTVVNAAKEPSVPFAVFKPTAFIITTVLEKIAAGQELSDSEQEEADNFRKRVGKLCETAYNLGVPILIDAEDCRYQSFFDDVVTGMMEKYNHERAIVYNTMQMYRKDRLDFLKESYRKAKEGDYYLGVKFVRGAYMERERARAIKMGYSSPIHETKELTDRDYDLALEYSMEHIDRIYIFNGTHNEKSAAWLAELMQKHGIAKNDTRCFFSQLYGMSDHITFNLAEEGYLIAKYLPYGPIIQVLPYLIRRMEENTSVAGQTGRELSLIKTEMKRRKGLI